MPSFIKKQPFYTTLGGEGEGDDGDYLQHQRREEKQETSKSRPLYRQVQPAATKWRKGSCTNCGAMGHDAKNCLERPRKKGAKWTGKDIKADLLTKASSQTFDEKRDRYKDYDPREYSSVVADYHDREQMLKQSSRGAGDDDEGDEGDRYADEYDMSKHQSNATRQLRLREDTAKYLLDLNPESGKYDPKTRSLVDGGATALSAEKFAEEGFMRSSGDAAEFARAGDLAHAALMSGRGGEHLHLQANPTAGEMTRKIEEEMADRNRRERMAALEAKYGTSLRNPIYPVRKPIAESDHFHEYLEDGTIKGAPKPKHQSKYAKDVLINNHTSVWGSWWNNFNWGYACCHSTIKNSWCTSGTNIKALQDAERRRTGADLQEEAGEDAEDTKEQTRSTPPPESTTKKRTREEMANGVTDEEMEEYRRKKAAYNDPMAKMLGKDILL